MTQFALTNWQAAKAIHVNNRQENHGDELVDAKDIKLRIEFENMRLDDWFGRGLRLAIYAPSDSATLDGVPETTTAKRTDLIEPPLALKTELSGYLFSIRRGIGKSKKLMVEQLPDASAKSFKLDPKEGGTCVLTFTVRVSGLEQEEMGKLDSMGGRDVEILMIPPKLQEGTLPEGDAKPVNPFKLSVVDGEIVDNNPTEPDATDMFLGEHAGDEDSGEAGEEEPA